MFRMLVPVHLPIVAFFVCQFVSTPTTVFAFVPILRTTRTACARSPSLSDTTGRNPSSSLHWFDAFLETAQRRYRIAQRSQQEGAGFKQIVANVIAGDEYDAVAINQEIDDWIQSAPVVLFTWEASPSCQQALRALGLMKIQPYQIVRLDNPWDKGHKIRAELGKRQKGKCSVPSIYINGEYIGGYDSGIDAERPGLVDLAFTGALQERLRKAGVLFGGSSTTPMLQNMSILE